jgi:hypothetical protein
VQFTKAAVPSVASLSVHLSARPRHVLGLVAEGKTDPRLPLRSYTAKEQWAATSRDFCQAWRLLAGYRDRRCRAPGSGLRSGARNGAFARSRAAIHRLA